MAQDTFYVGTLKGVGRVYQQTVIDTYSKVGFAKLYDTKTPITAAEMLNDRVVPFFDQHDAMMSRSSIFPSLSASRQAMMARMVIGFSQSRRSSSLTGLDPLGDGDLAFGDEQLAPIPHFAQIHADRIIGAADIVVVKIARGLRRRRRPRRQP